MSTVRRETKGLTKYYYASCNHSSHGVGGWSSRHYKTQRPAENAKRMHNKMNAGHGAVVLTIEK